MGIISGTLTCLGWALLISCGGYVCTSFAGKYMFTLFFYLMKPDFTNEQASKMYDILVEIHSTLKDKSKNTYMKPNVCERGWLLGIDELLYEIDKENKNLPAD